MDIKYTLQPATKTQQNYPSLRGCDAYECNVMVRMGQTSRQNGGDRNDTLTRERQPKPEPQTKARYTPSS